MKLNISHIGRTLKNHLPEILTVSSLIGIGVGDYFIVTGVKEDNKKKEIAGGLIHVGSAACIVASNRVSNAQKLSLIAAGAASATQFRDYKKVVKEQVGDEKYEEIERVYNEEELQSLMKEADEADKREDNDSTKKKIFYFPQLHKMIQEEPDRVSIGIVNINALFTEMWQVSVSDFFNFIDRNIVKNDPELKEVGDLFGWRMCEEDPESGLTAIQVQEYTKKLPSGEEVTFIYFFQEPLKFEEWDDYYNSMWDEAIREENEKHGIDKDVH